jgi:hypothetical protein
MIVLKWYLLVGLLFSTGLITLAIAAGKMDWIQKEFKLDDYTQNQLLLAVLIVGTLFWPYPMISYLKRSSIDF